MTMKVATIIEAYQYGQGSQVTWGALGNCVRELVHSGDKNGFRELYEGYEKHFLRKNPWNELGVARQRLYSWFSNLQEDSSTAALVAEFLEYDPIKGEKRIKLIESIRKKGLNYTNSADLAQHLHMREPKSERDKLTLKKQCLPGEDSYDAMTRNYRKRDIVNRVLWNVNSSQKARLRSNYRASK